MHTLTASDGVELSYRTIGDGPLNVVLVHGWMVSSVVHDEFLEALGSDGLRLIVPDLRGSGRSGRPEQGYTLEQYGKDVLAVADAAGAKSFVIVGHSMGGLIAQWLAATEPSRITGAVLICPVAASGTALPDDTRNLFRNSGENREMQATILGLALKDLSPAGREKLLNDAGTVAAACIQGAFDTWADAHFADKLAAIRTPVLVVGTDDIFLPPDFLRGAIVNKIAHAGFAYLPGAGHYPLVERPRETAAVVRAFLVPFAR